MRRLLILLAFIAQPAWGQAPRTADDCVRIHGPLFRELNGQAFAQNGVTLMMIPNDSKDMRMIAVRLRGIRAPELRDRQGAETVLGAQSRAGLADILGPVAPVKCSVVAWDTACVPMAHCIREGSNTHLSWEMVYAGWAYVDIEMALNTTIDAAQLHAAEARARKERLGLWRVWLPPEHR